jgi:hypothetical protein
LRRRFASAGARGGASLVMGRPLAAVPVVALLVVSLAPVSVFLVAGDVGKHRRLRLRGHIRLRIKRFAHISIVGGAWMKWGGRPWTPSKPIEEARP